MRTLALIALAPAVTAFAPATPAPRAVALQATVEDTVVDVVETIIEDVDVKDELLSVVGAAVDGHSDGGGPLYCGRWRFTRDPRRRYLSGIDF